MIIPDTNQVQQVAQTVAEVKTQLSPYVATLAIAAGWAGRELRNFNAWLFNACEYVRSHGGVARLIWTLIWNPPTK